MPGESSWIKDQRYLKMKYRRTDTNQQYLYLEIY